MKQKIKKIYTALNGPARLFLWVAMAELAFIIFSLFFEVRLVPKTGPLFVFNKLGFINRSAVSNDVVLDSANQPNRNNPPSALDGPSAPAPAPSSASAADPELEKKVLPSEGAELPVTWGDLGRRLVESGVIDQTAFEGTYNERGGMSPEMKNLLTGSNNGKLKITAENSGFILNLLWALGLGNKNEILEKGEMNDPQYGGAGNFASTGGWSLAKGKAMDHYSKYSFIKLTSAQQQLVDKTSRGIYRPCCGNSTHFPDCNHGMAMLGLLELMASQGIGETEMYKYALKVNAYWFPDTYLTIAKYLQAQGTTWEKASPQEILGNNYSSGSGYQRIVKQTSPVQPQGGTPGCGV
ncbi:MAG: hypothetical protein AAB486_02080 [Patescibacteria group bacterium]